MAPHDPTDPFGLVGQVLDGQFKVERLVGEGGFSTVYRGHHLGLSEPIAIKCLKLPPALSGSLIDTFVQRFRDESRILYKLSQGNLNIVRSIAAGSTTTSTGLVVPYMILEWLEGRSVANDFTIRRTTGQQGRSLDEIVKLFGTAADGLAFAHSQGVVHRDLNPGNLFLAGPVGGSPLSRKMKVLDFGVAKIMDDSALKMGPRSHTLGQIRIFAPAYGTPEQFDDSIGKVGPATDVYAFALILLEAMRDRAVNDGNSLGDFAQAAIDPKRRPTPRMLKIDVPDEVETVFARATSLDPQQRWATGGDFWQALTVAVKLATEKRYEQAARETPPLALGKNAPPASASGSFDIKRTVPLGTALPKLPIPKSSGSPKSADGSPSTQRYSSADGIPSVAGDDDGDEPTRVATGAQQESVVEEEATRVRQSNDELLREIALAEASKVTTMPPDRSSSNPPPGPGGKLGGTLVMAPGSAATEARDAAMAAARRQMEASMGTVPGGFEAGFGPPSGQPAVVPPSNPQMPAASAPPGAPQNNRALAGTMPLGAMNPAVSAAFMGNVGAGMPMGTPQAPGVQPHGGVHPHAMGQQPQMASTNPNASPNMWGAPSMEPAPSTPTNKLPLIVVGAVAFVLVAGGVGIALGLRSRGSSTTTGPVASVTAVATETPPVPPPAPVPTPEPPPAVAEPTPAPPATVAEPTPAPPEASAEPTNGGGGAGAAPTGAPVPTAPTAVATQTAAPTPTGGPTATPTAKPEADPNAWNESAARSKLSQANGVLSFCKKEGGQTGPGTASVTFLPDGSVTSVALDPPYAGTKEGDCVSGQFRRVKANAYQGGPQVVKHSFVVPK